MELRRKVLEASEAIKARGAANELCVTEIQRLKELPPLHPSDPESIQRALHEFDEALEIWSEILTGNVRERTGYITRMRRFGYYDYHTLSFARVPEVVLPLGPTEEAKKGLVLGIRDLLEGLTELREDESFQTLKPGLRERLRECVEAEQCGRRLMLAMEIEKYAPKVEYTTAEMSTEEPTTAEMSTAEPTTAEMSTVEPPTAELSTVEPPTAELPTMKPSDAASLAPVERNYDSAVDC